jgi:hypothetical protein
MEELIPIFLFLCVAAVLIFRPITTKAGKLLEAIAKEKIAARSEQPESARSRLLLEHISNRLDLIEERLDFTERLVSTSRRPGPLGIDRLDPIAGVKREGSLDQERDYLG